MTKIKIYVAGKVNPNSVFGTHDWRINFCKALEEKTGFTIHNLDPTKTPKENWDENDSSLVFGRDCYMISQADIVIVYLTDDIGLAPLNGKFNKDQKEIGGRQYINWKDPFVATTCDRIAGNIDEVALAISDFLASSYKSKDVSIITQNMEYYKNKLLGKDII